MLSIQYLLLPLCCMLLLCVFLPGQENVVLSEPTEGSGVARSEREAAELGPQNKAFMDAFNEYRLQAKILTEKKLEYQNARPERQAEIDAEYAKLYQQGLEQFKKITDLALDAHVETPNRNPTAINLLYSMVQHEFERENYEESVRLFRRMESSGIMNELERFYAFAGLAALASMNYDEAEKWLESVTESGSLGEIIRNWGRSKSGSDRARAIQGQLMSFSENKEAWAKEQEIRKAETEAGQKDPEKKLPKVEIITTKGKIVLELFENEAPNTVANFISLVERGFYDGIVFHRVLPNFMAQVGCPRGTGTGGPGYTFDCETGNRFPKARKHFRGSVSMANAGPNTNGSQFFLTFVPTSFLDGRHTVFGRVVEGFEVLADIQRIDPDDQDGDIPERDRIVTARVLNKRSHDYEVKRNRGR